MNIERYTRGSVWWFTRELHEKGITWGKHPCVIISSTRWNSYSSSVVVIPCTTDPFIGTVKGIM